MELADGPHINQAQAIIDSPLFSVHIDQPRIRELVQTEGLGEKGIGQLHVKIRGGTAFLNIAYYSPSERSVNLFPESAFRDYRKYTLLAKDIIAGDSPPKENSFKEVLTTTRLPGYLKSAPPERASRFARKLILTGVNRELNSVLIHELKHAIDLCDKPPTVRLQYKTALFMMLVNMSSSSLYHYMNGTLDSPLFVPVNAFCSLVAGICGYYIGNSYDPDEIAARRFAESLNKSSKWKNLISIQPKLD